MQHGTKYRREQEAWKDSGEEGEGHNEGEGSNREEQVMNGKTGRGKRKNRFRRKLEWGGGKIAALGVGVVRLNERTEGRNTM